MGSPNADTPGAGFTILAVCTANQCRSPLIELQLRRGLAAAGRDWVVRSAGTSTDPGRDLLPGAREAMVHAGLDDVEWSSTPLTLNLVDSADLIIVAAADHRAAIARMSPRALPRTYLLKQIARMCDVLDALDVVDDRAAGLELLDALRGARAVVQPVPTGRDDLVDPSGHSRRAFRRTMKEVTDAVTAILRPVTPSEHEAAG